MVSAEGTFVKRLAMSNQQRNSEEGFKSTTSFECSESNMRRTVAGK